MRGSEKEVRYSERGLKDTETDGISLVNRQTCRRLADRQARQSWRSVLEPWAAGSHLLPDQRRCPAPVPLCCCSGGLGECFIALRGCETCLTAQTFNPPPCPGLYGLPSLVTLACAANAHASCVRSDYKSTPGAVTDCINVTASY